MAPTTPATDAYLAHNAIPVQFTAEDFDQVIDGGNFVTKVIYLPDPKYQELAVSGVETLVSTRLEPGVDPILEADKRGTILLIVRLGAIDLEMPSGPIAGAVMGAPIGGTVIGTPGAIAAPAPGGSLAPAAAPVTEVPPGNLPPGVTPAPPAPAESVPVDTAPAPAGPGWSHPAGPRARRHPDPAGHQSGPGPGSRAGQSGTRAQAGPGRAQAVKSNDGQGPAAPPASIFLRGGENALRTELMNSPAEPRDGDVFRRVVSRMPLPRRRSSRESGTDCGETRPVNVRQGRLTSPGFQEQDQSR